MYALLGPNGAGKTTTVHVLTTLITPDAGEIRVGGHDLGHRCGGRALDDRRHRPVLGGRRPADRAREPAADGFDLHHLGRDEGRRRIDDLLERFELADDGTKVVATYSGGMKRRLDLAMTLMGEPRIVFLDEPTSGVDPRGRRTMWQIVRDLVADGVTIFLTTQYLEEADELANRIAMLDHGRIVAEGTPAELKRLVPGGHIRLEFSDADALELAATKLPDARRDADGLALAVPTDGGAETLRRVLDQLDGSAIAVTDVSLHTPDLDDVFLALTGQHDPRKAASS